MTFKQDQRENWEEKIYVTILKFQKKIKIYFKTKNKIAYMLLQ